MNAEGEHWIENVIQAKNLAKKRASVLKIDQALKKSKKERRLAFLSGLSIRNYNNSYMIALRHSPIFDRCLIRIMFYQASLSE